MACDKELNTQGGAVSEDAGLPDVFVGSGALPDVTGKTLLAAGWEQGPAIGEAIQYARKWRGKKCLGDIWSDLEMVRADPDAVVEDEGAEFRLQQAARQIIAQRPPVYTEMREAPVQHTVVGTVYNPRAKDPYELYGVRVHTEEDHDAIEVGALRQLQEALRMPVARRGALMPDAHIGYGLPIGGVIDLENALWVFGVGYDISCGMNMTLYPADSIPLQESPHIQQALMRHTRFGVGASYTDPLDHPVMEDPLWHEMPELRRLLANSRSQLGSSGSGNHFIDVGELVVSEDIPGQVQPGRYAAIMTHSGSRGLGYKIATTFHDYAQDQRNLPPDKSEYAWLDADSEVGQKYWAAMQLAGRYARANHELIHANVAAHFGVQPVANIFNRHNFAWDNGDGTYRHRKGATPAGEGVVGIIPGSMGQSSYVCVGRGGAAAQEALHSTSHGAGRWGSRTAAKKSISRAEARAYLAQRGVTFVGQTGRIPLDEAPQAYKDIEAVIAQQAAITQPVAEFKPAYVRMADD